MERLKSPGMRTIKTSLIVAICLILSKLLNLNYPFYAAIAGIICIQNTVKGSLNAAKDRIVGTIIGSALGIVFVHAFSYNPLSSGVGVLILLYFLKVIKLEDSYRVACVVYLATFIPGHGPPITYGLHRTLATIIGIVIALIVNLIISPPQYADDIKKLSSKLVNDLILSCGDFFILKYEVNLSSIGRDIFKIETLIKSYKQDVEKSKIEIMDIDKSDSLVLYSEKVYNHLGIINELNELGYRFELNEENASYIYKLYNKEIPFYEYEKDCNNEVFNYHIKKIIKYLERLKALSLDI